MTKTYYSGLCVHKDSIAIANTCGVCASKAGNENARHDLSGGAGSAGDPNPPIYELEGPLTETWIKTH